MKLNIKFHPLLFQASLAAGGVALMPFNYLQYGIDHGKGLITWAKIPWDSMTAAQYALYLPLIALMLAFTVLHFGLTGYFLWRLAKWLGTPGAFGGFINVPQKNQNAGIFAVVASLAMTANVFWGPLGFFVPWVSNNLQALMLPSLIFFGILWVALLFLEVKALRTWFAKGVDRTQFNFIWLLDVFAFALVSLAGSGIVAISTNTSIQATAAVATSDHPGLRLSVVALQAGLSDLHPREGSQAAGQPDPAGVLPGDPHRLPLRAGRVPGGELPAAAVDGRPARLDRTGRGVLRPHDRVGPDDAVSHPGLLPDLFPKE